MIYRVDATAGEPILLTKFVSYHTSRGVPAGELVDRCRRTLDRAVRRGRDAVQAEQRQWLDDFWQRSDVEVARPSRGPAGAALEPLPASPRLVPGPTASGIPAKGVTGSGYSGHYFWDTEIFVLAVLDVHHAVESPGTALRFRYSTARRRPGPGAPS